MDNLDNFDRAIINTFQGGFPIAENPFAEAALMIGIDEQDLMDRIETMVSDGVLSRFGPLYDADAMGGAVTLCAMDVPPDDFDSIADIVNGYPEVAHNYERQHKLNMWFVVAAESRGIIDAVLLDIQDRTGLVVHDMPKQDEFFIGLRLEV